MAVYRAAPPEALIVAPLDVLTAIYHRPSGITHLLAAPAPEILEALAESADLHALHARLSARFDLEGGEALQTRIDELIAAGLVTAS